jgi:O-antigen ligase
MNRLLMPLYLLIAAIPAGIAMQNLMVVVALLLMLYAELTSPDKSALPFKEAFRSTLTPTLLALGFILTCIVATLLNPANPDQSFVKYLGGHLAWILLPPLLLGFYGRLHQEQLARLERFLQFVLLIWGVVALSQFLFGWRINGIVWQTDVPRPRGFYSHPLTFAYAAFVLWPYVLVRFFNQPRRMGSWIGLLSVATIILTTQSRTVQLCALMYAVYAVFSMLSGRARKIALIALVAVGCAVVVIPSPISEKIHRTFSSEGVDKKSDYPDDRLAFWHAHLLMMQERPLLGHGIELDAKYRAPYYDKIGLSAFTKKYEAHNVFIQIITNAGLVGLIFFLAYWGWFITYARRQIPQGLVRQTIIHTFAVYGLASLSQNSFQDGEVRLVLTLFCSAVLLVSCARESQGHR